MRKISWISAVAMLSLSGCAAQAPESQLTKKEMVRICQGHSCVNQHSSTVTFQGEPVDAEAERRLAQLTQLAEKNPQAAYDLGLRLLRGDGVERNSYQALEWMRKAGDQGLPAAQLAVGRMYLFGFEEMGSDPAEAQAWLTRAAANGSKEAQQLLPQAQAAKQDEQALYQVREAYRTSWLGWYSSAPYYWHWQPSGWLLR